MILICRGQQVKKLSNQSTMKKYADISISEFPTIKVTFTGEAAQANNFPLYLDEVKQSYDLQNKVALIFDATKAVLPNISYQQMQAQWLKDNTQMMKDFCVGTAYVIPNLVIRNVLKAIFAFQAQPVPYLVCSSQAEAESWVKQQLSGK